VHEPVRQLIVARGYLADELLAARMVPRVRQMLVRDDQLAPKRIKTA